MAAGQSRDIHNRETDDEKESLFSFFRHPILVAADRSLEPTHKGGGLKKKFYVITIEISPNPYLNKNNKIKRCFPPPFFLRPSCVFVSL